MASSLAGFFLSGAGFNCHKSRGFKSKPQAPKSPAPIRGELGTSPLGIRGSDSRSRDPTPAKRVGAARPKKKTAACELRRGAENCARGSQAVGGVHHYESGGPPNCRIGRFRHQGSRSPFFEPTHRPRHRLTAASSICPPLCDAHRSANPRKDIRSTQNLGPLDGAGKPNPLEVPHLWPTEWIRGGFRTFRGAALVRVLCVVVLFVVTKKKKNGWVKKLCKP